MSCTNQCTLIKGQGVRGEQWEVFSLCENQSKTETGTQCECPFKGNENELQEPGDCTVTAPCVEKTRPPQPTPPLLTIEISNNVAVMVRRVKGAGPPKPGEVTIKSNGITMIDKDSGEPLQPVPIQR